MYAYSNILAALIERGRTGRGRRIDLSMLESMTEWMGFPLYYGYDGAPPPPRAGARHAAICPYGPFRCGDGRTVMLAVQNEREWAAFCAVVLDDPDIARDPALKGNANRLAARERIHQMIEAAFARYSADQVIALLDKAQIAFGQVNEIADLWAHPQLEARSRWRSVGTPNGPIRSWLPPGVDDARMDPVPGVGEHTEAILTELGFDRGGIDALKRGAVI
jgi:crotonobetainyl-CoA:carnitine CoA-transferase CaiB-like acyl-CoA transferase